MNFSIKRLEIIIWMLAPACICFVLLILCIIPKHVWGFSYIVPFLPLLPIFYWGRLQSAEMPYWFVAVVGFLTDTVSTAPLGLSAALYLLFLAIVHAQSKYMHKEGFMVIWGYFMILVAMVAWMQWIVMSLLVGKLYAFTPAIIQWFITASIYPLFHKLFNDLSEHIKQRRWIILHG